MTEVLRHDLRLALRALAHDRAFSLSAIATLALGVGAVTTLAAIVAGVLLAPLPYRDPDRLVAVLHGASVNGPLAPGTYLELRRIARSFSGMAAAQAWGANLTADGRTERVPALQVTGTLFGVLGRAPVIGRTITAGDVAAEQRVVVLAHGLWVRRFGRDPAIVGRTLVINGESFSVIGVMPAGFRFAPFWQTKAEAWIPLSLADRAADRTGRSLRVFARLRDGVDLDEARAELSAIDRQLVRTWPESHTGITTGVLPLADKAVGPVRPLLLALLGLAAGLLLVAAVNLAMLVVSRTTSRQGELAVRAALGATEGRLLRGALLEGALVGLAGTVGGVVCAMLGTALLGRTLPADSLPPHANLHLSPQVVLFAAVLATLVALAATCLPAWRLGRHASAALQPTRTVAGTRTARRARSTLVGVEVTLAFALAAAALLFARTVVNLQRVELGFTPDRLAAMSVSLDGALHSGEASAAFFAALADRIGALPAVSAASAINHLPLAGDLWTLDYAVEGRPAPSPGLEEKAAYRVVLPRYFSTIGQRMTEGRDFSQDDRADSAPVVIVNEQLARRQWPGESALGRRLRFRDVQLTVVGVVENVPQATLVDPIQDEMYLPLAQRPIQSAARSPMTVIVRAAADVDLFQSLRSVVWSLDRQAAVYDTMTLDDVLDAEMWRERLGTRVGGIFAGVALLLAALGISSVVAYAVTRRSREFGVRLALGGTASHVVTLALREAAAPVFVGLLVGLALVIGLARLLTTLLVGVTPHDPITLVAAAMALLATAVIAAWRPAARASRVDPAVVLRDA